MYSLANESQQYAVGQIPFNGINKNPPTNPAGGEFILYPPPACFPYAHRGHPSFCLNVFSCTTQGRRILNEIIKDT